MPVLELDDGTRLNSTAGIWNYLEAEYPPALLAESSVTPDDKGIRVFLYKPFTIVKPRRFI